MNNGRKPRVIHVLKSSIYSGAENVVFTIMKQLCEKYDFIYVATEGAIREFLEREQLPYILVESFDWIHLKKIIREQKPDIVHAHDFSATVLCAMIPGKFQLISHLHYDPPWTKYWNLKTMLYRVVGYRMKKVLVVSEKSYQNMIFSNYSLPEHMAIGNPIDIGRICRLSEQQDINDKYDVIFVGRLSYQKYPQKFLEIINKIVKKGIAIRAVMLGNGDLQQECENLIYQYDLQDYVEMKGFCENPYIYIKNSRVLCLTSRYEGYGLVIIEANVLGVPVLSTRTSGTEEVLGMDAPELCDTEEEFVEKLSELLSDQKKYDLWKRSSEKRIKNITTIDQYMDTLDSVYKDVIRGM